jgi:acyl-coenzyme A thioesterase PaaI-like protein
MTSPWTFGEAPLDETAELAAVLRRVTSLALSMESADPRVHEVIVTLTEAERALAGAVPPSPVPRVGGAIDGDGRVYLDHSRDIGAYNPCFPEYDVTVDGDTASGTITFPIAYEGPPGLVHGGFLAVFFDSVIQHHNCDVGVAGKTTNLELRYRRPTPLLTPLRFEVERVANGDRIESTARLYDGDRLCAEVRMRALAGDRAALPAVSPRRSGA